MTEVALPSPPSESEGYFPSDAPAVFPTGSGRRGELPPICASETIKEALNMGKLHIPRRHGFARAPQPPSPNLMGPGQNLVPAEASCQGKAPHTRTVCPAPRLKRSGDSGRRNGVAEVVPRSATQDECEPRGVPAVQQRSASAGKAAPAAGGAARRPSPVSRSSLYRRRLLEAAKRRGGNAGGSDSERSVPDSESDFLSCNSDGIDHDLLDLVHEALDLDCEACDALNSLLRNGSQGCSCGGAAAQPSYTKNLPVQAASVSRDSLATLEDLAVSDRSLTFKAWEADVPGMGQDKNRANSPSEKHLGLTGGVPGGCLGTVSKRGPKDPWAMVELGEDVECCLEICNF